MIIEVRYIVFILFSLFLFQTNAQEIQTSAPVKMPSKTERFDILGKNDNGIFVHYQVGNKDELELFNNQLRSIIRREIKVKDRNSRIENIFLRETGAIAFYSQIDGEKQYLKASIINTQLQTLPGLILDSLAMVRTNTFEPYYVKQSSNLDYFVFFKIYKSAGRLNVRFHILDKDLEILHVGNYEVEDQGLVLKSFKINNRGEVYVVIARENKSVINDYIYDKIYTFLYNSEKSDTERKVFEENESLFKNIITKIDQKTNKAVTVFNYRNKKNTDDIGHIVLKSGREPFSDYLRFPYTEKYVSGIKSIDVKNWKEKALLIRPQHVIMQSDGGCLILTEAQYKYTRVIRQNNPYGYGYGYGYYNYYGDTYTRQYDQHHFFDILGVSINDRGLVNWEVDLPKTQITEDDEGLYSSFAIFETNNLLKILFNENVYSSGNLIEYNLNPNGKTKRSVVANSDKSGFTLIPRMGKQISKNEILIPAEQKNNLQLLLLKY